MRKVLCVLLSMTLLASVFVIVSEAYETDVIRVSQLQSNWCWAACADMLAKSQYYIGTLDQEDAVVYIKGGNYNLKGNSLEIKNAATYLTDSNVSFIRGNTLTNEATLRKIKSGYPVVALMFYDDGDGNEANDEGHSIIIFKGNDSYNFAFYDPSPNKTDEYWYSYSDFVNGISGGPFSVTYEWRYYVSVSGFASGV